MSEEPGAAREEVLMGLAFEASERLVEGLVSFGFLDAPKDEPARVQAREKSRHLFLFVIISVLLEGRDRATAQRLKDAFASELMQTRRHIRSVVKKTMTRGDAADFGRKLDQAANQDPFAPYYDSFLHMRKDPEKGPFGIFARLFSEHHFDGVRRRGAYSRIFDLAAELSDQIVSRI